MLDICPYGNIIQPCLAPPPPPTPSTPLLNPARRDILSFLVSQERAVNDIVATLNLPQPSVSKHTPRSA